VIEDLRQLGGGAPIACDLCLIGAGAAGITLAREFIGSGLTVSLVESGGLDFDSQTQALYAGKNVGLPEHGVDIGRLRFFGGTTNHWGGRCTPLAPLDFAVRSWIPHSGWPISRDDLESFYRRARDVCGLGAPYGDADILSALDIQEPALPPNLLRLKLWEHAPYPWSFGAIYREQLRNAADLRVLLYANLTEIATNAERSAISAIGVRSLEGATRIIRARCYVLCCGAIENARLLLSTADERAPALGNRHDLVGRFYMDHFRGRVATLVTADPQPEIEAVFNYFGDPAQRLYQTGIELSPEAQRGQSLLNACAVFDYEGDPESGIAEAQAIWRELQDGKWAPDIGEKVWRVLRDLDGVAAMVRRRLSDDRHPVMPLKAGLIVSDIEQAPNPESRVTLSNTRDALGQRRVCVDWRATALERRTAKHFALSIGSALLRLGFGRCRIEPWLVEPPGEAEFGLSETYHQSGTTRMAADPRFGVVDADCRVHGMENLYIAGSSVFPTGGHANPTFTIVALALRLADHLKVTLRQFARAAP
jgi:choline dehydrogenase-like flavoprotein